MKSISFIIPCYNEEKRINKTFDALKNAKLPRGLRLEQVIFVNDGSKDKTVEKINKFTKKSNLQINLISYKQNRGKGNAIKVGMAESKADYTLFFDADMSTPLSELRKFASLMKHEVDVIIGTRKNGHSTVIKHQPLYRELLGKVFTKITQTVLQVNNSDFTCGFKAFSKKATLDIFEDAKISGWGYDAEIVFLAHKKGFSVKEMPVIWENDERTKVDLKSAIIKTLFELGQIRWYHSIKPAFALVSTNLKLSSQFKNLL